MTLTDEDKKRIADWITQKCGAMRCTCCGSQTWAIGEHANVLLGYNLHTTRFHYHEGTTDVSLICTNCGHMVLFNPGVIGFRPDALPVPAPSQTS